MPPHYFHMYHDARRIKEAATGYNYYLSHILISNACLHECVGCCAVVAGACIVMVKAACLTCTIREEDDVYHSDDDQDQKGC